MWAFLLWKCSSARDGPNVSNDNSWKLYQQWCRMPEAQRTAWIAAGTNVQVLSKYVHAKVVSVFFHFKKFILVKCAYRLGRALDLKNLGARDPSSNLTCAKNARHQVYLRIFALIDSSCFRAHTLLLNITDICFD